MRKMYKIINEMMLPTHLGHRPTDPMLFRTADLVSVKLIKSLYDAFIVI